MGKQETVSVTIETAGRLDKALATCVAASDQTAALGLSRARLQQLIKEGHVSSSGQTVFDPNAQAKGGQVYEITLPQAVPAQPQAQDLPLEIVYEDEDLIVINKPAGLVVHPAAGNWDGTLVNALLAHCGDSLSGIGGVARPGIVHRLDKDTSGLMVVAKNDNAHQKLTSQFADRSLSRIYQALVWGVPSPLAGEVEGAIGRHPRARQKMAIVTHGGKEALTFYETLEAFGTTASLVECKLATGRTHQIRVHLSSIGHAVIGDPLYSPRKAGRAGGKGLIAALTAFPRQALHAGQISFIHPVSGKTLKFKTSLPSDIKVLLRVLRKKEVV